MPRVAAPVEDRIAENVTVDPSTGCWLWDGPTSSGGYPALKIGGEKELLRPLMYRLAFGEPQSKLTRRPQVRMECKQQSCICPEHMIVMDDAHRELQQLRREIFQEGFRDFTRDPSNPKFRWRVSGKYINWKAAKIMEERQRALEVRQSPAVQAFIDQIRRKAVIIPKGV